MTFTDIIILIIVAAIVVAIIYKMIKNREAPCESCAYLKHCQKGCTIEKK